MDFTKKHCIPCEGGTKPFTSDQAQGYLKAVPGWEILEGEILKIQRKFEFRDFKEAMSFVNKVADLANSEDHHPNINIHSYKKVNITLTTHAIGGLSENDYIMAAKINQLVENY